MARSGSSPGTLEQELAIELGRQRPLLLALTLGVVAYAAGHGWLALSAGSLARVLAEGPRDTSRWLPGAMAGGEPSLSTLTYVGLGCAVVKAAAGAILAFSQRKLAAGVAVRLRGMLVRRLLDEGFTLPAPRVLASLSVRLREVEAGVNDGALTFVRALVQLALLAVCAIVVSPPLAAGAALGLSPFAWALGRLRGRTRAASGTAQSRVEELECGVDELVRNADIWRTHGAGARVLGAVERAGEAAARSTAGVETARAALSGANEVAAALAIVGVVALGTRFGALGGASGALLPFAAVFFMAYRPLRDLGDARGALARGAIALEAVRGVGGRPVTVPSGAPSVRRVWASPPLIELRELGAEGRGPATSCQLPPGEIACFVGPTGSGKTTLIRTLLGLERARGALLVDGLNVTNAPAGPAYRPFAWVPQDAPLVTGTLADNVLLLGGVTEDVQGALDAVGAGHLLASGAGDLVGPGGRSLSGGERRQVALARALATGLPVLVLDEPTEGLDSQTNRIVLQAIERLKGRRTVIIATHREDVVALADRTVTIGRTLTTFGAPALAAE